MFIHTVLQAQGRFYAHHRIFLFCDKTNISLLHNYPLFDFSEIMVKRLNSTILSIIHYIA